MDGSLHINVQRFRGGLVCKAHRLCVSLNSMLESNKEEEGVSTRCRFYIVYRQSHLGPVDPSFRALSGRLKFTVRRHKINNDSLSVGGRLACGKLRLVCVLCRDHAPHAYLQRERESSFLTTYWSESTLSCGAWSMHMHTCKLVLRL